MRNFVTVAAAIGLTTTFSLASQAQGLDELRTWTSTAGTTVIGSMVEQDATTVTLQVAGKATPVTVPAIVLCDDDQKYLKMSWLDRQDQRQFDQVKEHLRSVNEQPKTVSGLLIALHSEYPESPYAGLWAAVTLCLGTNEHSRAATLLQQTIDRIKKQQSADPTRHRMTYCSANNNLAVCMIKACKGDSAAAKMIEAIGHAETIPSVVSSNAMLLNELTSDASGAITFTQSTRLRLLNAVATAKTAGRGTDLPQGWHYSLDFDVPGNSAGSTKLQGIDAPRSELQLLASGTGFVVAPGIVLTTRPVVESTNYAGPKLVTVLTHQGGGNYRSELVQNLLIQETRSVATSATVATFSDGSSGVWTNYKYARPEDGELGAELAALRVPGITNVPLEIAERDPDNGTEERTANFQRFCGQQSLRKRCLSQGWLVCCVRWQWRAGLCRERMQQRRHRRSRLQVTGNRPGVPQRKNRANRH